MEKMKEEEKEKIKSQAAMEYLMTYGWAILIISLALGVLYSLGVFNPKNFTPRVQPGSCFVFRPNGPGTTDMLSLQGTCGYLPMYVASFNGVNAYVDLPTSVLGNWNQLTMGVWVKAPQYTGASWPGFIGSHTASGSSYNIELGIWTNTGHLHLEVDTDTGNYPMEGQLSIPWNKWFYAVLVYNGSSLTEYLNGVKGKSISATGKLKNVTCFQLGSGACSIFFNGTIANVQIYNTALSQQEIQYLYQEGLGGGPIRLANLVAWWPLNGDAKDYSGNNNHGTIYGGVSFIQNYNPP
jgi:hypothetical protein